jgi:protein ImuB
VFGGLHSPRPLPEEDALLALAREFTPRVEAPAPTPVLLDLSGLGRLWPTPHELGQALLDAAAARAIEAQAALAFSRAAALTLARARPGLTVVPAGGEAAALAPLPLDLLGLPADRQELFRRWGLRTIGDLARLPPVSLAERLGSDGPRLLRLARGEDEGLLVPAPLPECFETTLELDWPVDGLEPLAFLLSRVLEPLCVALAAHGAKAASLAVDLGLVDGTVHARVLKPAAPSGEVRTWRTLVLLDLEAHPLRDAIARITARAEPTPARPAQFSLLDPALPSPERLAETMARLHAWTAEGRGGSPQLVDTHRPGAFAVSTFAPGPLPRGRPEEAPPAPRVALRAYRPPRLAHVLTKGGVPVFVSAPGVRGAVVACAGPWRASGDWWDVAWSREEWDVVLALQPGQALAGGGVFRLFLDRLREEWFVGGELD